MSPNLITVDKPRRGGVRIAGKEGTIYPSPTLQARLLYLGTMTEFPNFRLRMVTRSLDSIELAT